VIMRDKSGVEKISKLASLPLSEKEISLFGNQLSKIVGFVAALNRLDTNTVSPTYQVAGKVNEFREDKPSGGLSSKEALSNSPRTIGKYIVTKGVFNVK